MSLSFIPLIVYILLVIVGLSMLVRMLLSFVTLMIPDGGAFANNPVSRFVFTITEPLISPFRRIVPMSGSIDWFSFLFAYITFYIVIHYVGILANAHFLFY